MPSRNTISLLLVGVFFLQSFGMVSHAQEENDPEYDLQVQEDMQGVNSNDEFSQIEKSVEKPLVDTKTMKGSRKLALSYIDGLEPYDANWIGKSPKLIGKPIPYYTDDTSEPIVYEWKIHCITTKDCGSIVVASLEGEYRIMETSTSGKSNYERLGDNKKGNKNKLYYYSAIDQYIESNDGVNISIDTVNPGKKSSDLKTELSDKKIKISGERKKGKLIFQKNTSSSSGSGTIVANVPGTNIVGCGGPLPCYNQFPATYGTVTCQSGCGPTALAIIFGYYDRKGTFPNLLPGVIASDTVVDQSMVNIIRGYMGTVCVNGEGSTIFGSLGLGMKYARDRGYTTSWNGTYYGVANMGVGGVMIKLKTEINAGRPLIVNYRNAAIPVGHIIAGYGFRTNASPIPDDVRVNLGWGGYPDKYLPVSGAITSTNISGGIAPQLVGMSLDSIVTVPMQ